jgi:predicted permease
MPRQTTVCGSYFRGERSLTALHKNFAKGSLVALLFAAAIYLSTQAAVPDLLPGVALGWKALFHVERAGVMLGAIGFVLLVAWRALSGEFPIKFGNVEYATKDVTSEAEEASGSQEYRLRLLEVLAELRNPATLEDDGPRV